MDIVYDSGKWCKKENGNDHGYDRMVMITYPDRSVIRDLPFPYGLESFPETCNDLLHRQLSSMTFPNRSSIGAMVRVSVSVLG